MKNVIAFDLSDFVRYVAKIRCMTGIQRVQAGVLLATLSEKKNDYAIDIVAYSDEKQCWQKIPSSLFIELCDLAQTETERVDRWRIILAKLSNLFISPSQYEFAAGSALINLGTAWSLPNYLLAVRNLRRNHNLKYVQYVHDLIPITLPDTCASGLPHQYTEWLISAFASTDLFLVNSRNTSNDLLKAAETLGVACPPVALATLDVGPGPSKQTEGSTDIIKRERIDRFVLLVGTLEPRKITYSGSMFGRSYWHDETMQERRPSSALDAKGGFSN